MWHSRSATACGAHDSVTRGRRRRALGHEPRGVFTRRPDPRDLCDDGPVDQHRAPCQRLRVRGLVIAAGDAIGMVPRYTVGIDPPGLALPTAGITATRNIDR